MLPYQEYTITTSHLTNSCPQPMLLFFFIYSRIDPKSLGNPLDAEQVEMNNMSIQNSYKKDYNEYFITNLCKR
jgi:hypothetical protein